MHYKAYFLLNEEKEIHFNLKIQWIWKLDWLLWSYCHNDFKCHLPHLCMREPLEWMNATSSHLASCMDHSYNRVTEHSNAWALMCIGPFYSMPSSGFRHWIAPNTRASVWCLCVWGLTTKYSSEQHTKQSIVHFFLKKYMLFYHSMAFWYNTLKAPKSPMHSERNHVVAWTSIHIFFVF